MTLDEFREMVLSEPGAAERVAELKQRMLIGHDLRQARKRAGLSQKELARRLGVTQPRIAAIERATDNVTLATVARYAAAVGAAVRVDLESDAAFTTDAVDGEGVSPEIGAERALPVAPRGDRTPTQSVARKRARVTASAV